MLLLTPESEGRWGNDRLALARAAFEAGWDLALSLAEAMRLEEMR